MLRARLYVEPAEALMIQAKAKILLRLLKHRRDKMKGHNEIFIIIIITSNDSKQAFKNPENCKFKKSENWIWRAFLSNIGLS